MATVGEDTFLRNSMMKKYKCIYFRDIGALCLTPYIEDDRKIQFETGHWLDLTESERFINA